MVGRISRSWWRRCGSLIGRQLAKTCGSKPDCLGVAFRVSAGKFVASRDAPFRRSPDWVKTRRRSFNRAKWSGNRKVFAVIEPRSDEWLTLSAQPPSF